MSLLIVAHQHMSLRQARCREQKLFRNSLKGLRFVRPDMYEIRGRTAADAGTTFHVCEAIRHLGISRLMKPGREVARRQVFTVSYGLKGGYILVVVHEANYGKIFPDSQSTQA